MGRGGRESGDARYIHSRMWSREHRDAGRREDVKGRKGGSTGHRSRRRRGRG